LVGVKGVEVDGFGVEVDDGRSIGAQRKEKKKKGAAGCGEKGREEGKIIRVDLYAVLVRGDKRANEILGEE